MFEQIPQSNPEQGNLKRYYIPVSLDECVIGLVNEDKRSIYPSKQRNGPDIMITMFEAIYETVNVDGEPTIERKMISDYVLSSEVQAILEKKYQNSMEINRGEQNE